MMTSMEKWNLLVAERQSNINQDESTIENQWENYFLEFFGYSKIFKEIERQRHITLGSRETVIPDIILRKDGKDIIDVELKRYSVPFSNAEEQIKSYLKQLGIPVGVFIGNEIRLCWLEYAENRLYSVPIIFKKDNPEGENFIEMVAKGSFSQEKIKGYIKNKMQSKLNVYAIQSELSEELLRGLLEIYFSEKYTEEEINNALSEYSFTINKKMELHGPVVSYPVYPSKGVKPTRQPEPSDNFPGDFSFIIIKTHEERVTLCQRYFNCSRDEALYHATRHSWRVSIDKVNNYSYVLSVINQYVKEVYRIEYWKIVGDHDKWEIDDEKAYGRYEFYGKVASDEIRNRFIGKMIPFKYRKQGMASPVVFSK